MNKRFVLFAFLLVIAGTFAFSDTLVDDKLIVKDRNDVFYIQNVYTKYYVRITFYHVIEDVYDIYGSINGGRSPRLGTARVYSQDFQIIVAQYLQRQADKDDPVWKAQSLVIARMLAESLAALRP